MISAYPTCIRRPSYGGSRRNIAMPFGMKKTKMAWLPDDEIFRRYVNSFWQNVRTWRTHRQTDRQTPHDSIGRACKASRGKNTVIYLIGLMRALHLHLGLVTLVFRRRTQIFLLTYLPMIRPRCDYDSIGPRHFPRNQRVVTTNLLISSLQKVAT